jgi:hypothetical protein
MIPTISNRHFEDETPVWICQCGAINRMTRCKCSFCGRKLNKERNCTEPDADWEDSQRAVPPQEDVWRVGIEAELASMELAIKRVRKILKERAR